MVLLSFFLEDKKVPLHKNYFLYMDSITLENHQAVGNFICERLCFN